MPPYEVGSIADPNLGQQIEGYRITRQIGHGGMGAVYQAVHESIEQHAAVKVLFPEFSTDEDAVSRFVSEARAASRVRHAGLVQIFFHGRFPDGTAYIVMEYLPGDSLKERLRGLITDGKRMPLPGVLRIGQQIASALSAVHREGIIHRDLKPANLILIADPEVESGERIKVVDFGIAKFDSGTTTEVGKTTVGRFLGTAVYASPEQCSMAGEIGPKADVYSLGIILYEMIAGRPPFYADQPGMVLGMHLFMAPRALWELAPEVPEPLDRLVRQMLAKEPDKRPTMEEVQTRLAAIKPGGFHGLWWMRRHRGVTSALAMVLLLAGGGTLWQVTRPQSVRPGQPVTSQPPKVITPPDLALSQMPDLAISSTPDLAPPPMTVIVQPPPKKTKVGKRKHGNPVAPSTTEPASPAPDPGPPHSEQVEPVKKDSPPTQPQTEKPHEPGPLH